MKKRMMKLAAISMSVLMAAALGACGSNGGDSSSGTEAVSYTHLHDKRQQKRCRQKEGHSPCLHNSFPFRFYQSHLLRLLFKPALRKQPEIQILQSRHLFYGIRDLGLFR